ncbi:MULTISPECIES: glycosyltransferase family 2 protein [Microbacterium]|uniref:glycosyltransferase n=1 Tax=Microbacterium TaxID=33882 RepID=UPI0027884536|nr:MULTISPECIES: glycosyltransferase [Microbacterium]MDQ1076065.1 hypothetical protein [Microbacterium sp. SORGH_AS_0969]MDQ1116304.1 hypothetical protein [Microbacterium testaceum]
MRVDAEYVLPLRWHDDHDLDELTAYLRDLSRWIDVTVVDGSAPALFRAHAHAWGGHVRHVQPAVEGGANGKVRGVLSGLAVARHERVVLADDDVRHTPDTLAALVTELQDADLVKPQNVFFPRPWHAHWDTARSLVNRALGADYPGTYGLRRSALPRGYDADALFENCEMERTVRAGGGRVRARRDLFVPRRPPSARRFWSQRVRQAYDSHAQPVRLMAELAIIPVVWRLRRRRGILAFLTLAVIGLGELGRRRAGGGAVYPRSAALWVPVWAIERGLCSWAAVGLRLRGGVPYAGARLRLAATPLRTLRLRVTDDAVRSRGGRDS